MRKSDRLLYRFFEQRANPAYQEYILTGKGRALVPVLAGESFGTVLEQF